MGVDEKDEEQQENGEEQAAEGQPSTDPTIHYADVDAGAVGQGTEEPRPDPTEEIKQRYQQNAEEAESRRGEEDEEAEEK